LRCLFAYKQKFSSAFHETL